MSASLNLDALRLELAVKAKNGLDFILAASLLWLSIGGLWLLPNRPAVSSLFTLMASGAMLPLAWLFSKLLRTTWTIPDNPLQPLGLWLNVAQLFYFPLLFFIYARYPQHFIMTYGVITGAHFFPYAWFYHTRAYAVAAGVIAVGCVLLGLRLAPGQLYLIPVFLVVCLLGLTGALYRAYRLRLAQYTAAAGD